MQGPSLRDLAYDISWLWAASLPGKLLVASCAACAGWTLTVMVVSLLTRARPSLVRRAWHRVLVAGLLVASALGASAVCSIEAARAKYLTLTLPSLAAAVSSPGPIDEYFALLVAFSAMHSSTQLTAVATALLALGALPCALRLGHHGRFLVVSSAVTSVVAVCFVLSRTVVVRTCSHAAESWTQTDRLLCLAEVNDGNTALLAQGRFLVLVLMAIVCAGAIVRAMRKRADFPRTTRVHLVGATAVFLMGTSAFAATRSRERDVTRKPSPSPVGESCTQLHVAPPTTQRSCEPPAGPILEYENGQAHLDGLPTTLETLGPMLDAKVSLWHDINPGRTFRGMALLAAPAHTPAQELLPWLRAIEASQVGGVRAMTRAPSRVARTATLGALEYTARCCAVRAPLRSRSLPGNTLHGETWGALVEALERSEE
jgi:hypothetical protein